MNLKEIASFLPGKWSVLETELIRTDGFRLWFREGGYGNEGRIAIHFSRPRNPEGEYVTLWTKVGGGKVCDPSITVGSTKSSDKIAKDIQRRIMPEAEVVFALAQTRINEENTYKLNRTKAIEALAVVAGGEPNRHYQTKELTGEIDPFICAGVVSFQSSGYGRFKVSSGDSISLELTSMNFETAAAIAAAIRNVLTNKK